MDLDLAPQIDSGDAAAEETAAPAVERSRRWDLAWLTVREALMLVMLSMALSILLTVSHFDFLLASRENANSIHQLAKIDVRYLLLLAVVGAPLLEESLFRGIPSAVLRAVAKRRYHGFPQRCQFYWPIGAAAALLFAVLHGAGSVTIHVPLPQLMVGMWSWHVVNTRGLRYSMLLHASYNAVPVGLVFLKLSHAA